MSVWYIILVSFAIMPSECITMRRIWRIAIRRKLCCRIWCRIIKRFSLTIIGRITSLHFSIRTHRQVFTFSTRTSWIYKTKRKKKVMRNTPKNKIILSSGFSLEITSELFKSILLRLKMFTWICQWQMVWEDTKEMN